MSEKKKLSLCPYDNVKIKGERRNEMLSVTNNQKRQDGQIMIIAATVLFFVAAALVIAGAYERTGTAAVVAMRATTTTTATGAAATKKKSTAGGVGSILAAPRHSSAPTPTMISTTNSGSAGGGAGGGGGGGTFAGALALVREHCTSHPNDKGCLALQSGTIHGGPVTFDNGRDTVKASKLKREVNRILNLDATKHSNPKDVVAAQLALNDPCARADATAGSQYAACKSAMRQRNQAQIHCVGGGDDDSGGSAGDEPNTMLLAR